MSDVFFSQITLEGSWSKFSGASKKNDVWYVFIDNMIYSSELEELVRNELLWVLRGNRARAPAVALYLYAAIRVS